jgi:hypothetical protein
MIAYLGILAAYFLSDWFKKRVGDFEIIFYMEVVAIEAFGISWITKGETLFPDGEHYIKHGIKKMMR